MSGNPIAHRIMITRDRMLRDIDDASLLTRGWLDGDGEEIDRGVIDATRRALYALTDDGVAVPHVCPTPDGGLRAEWTDGPDDPTTMLSAEFDATDGGVRVYMHALDESESVDIDLPAGEHAVVLGFIRGHAPHLLSESAAA